MIKLCIKEKNEHHLMDWNRSGEWCNEGAEVAEVIKYYRYRGYFPETMDDEYCEELMLRLAEYEIGDVLHCEITDPKVEGPDSIYRYMHFIDMKNPDEDDDDCLVYSDDYI